MAREGACYFPCLTGEGRTRIERFSSNVISQPPLQPKRTRRIQSAVKRGWPACALRISDRLRFRQLEHLFATQLAYAADEPPEHGTISVLFENDVFYNTDRDYTNGVQFAYTSGPDDNFDTAVRVARLLSRCPGSAARCVLCNRHIRETCRPRSAPRSPCGRFETKTVAPAKRARQATYIAGTPR